MGDALDSSDKPQPGFLFLSAVTREGERIRVLVTSVDTIKSQRQKVINSNNQNEDQN